MTLHNMHPASIAKLQKCEMLAMHKGNECDEATAGASTNGEARGESCAYTFCDDDVKDRPKAVITSPRPSSAAIIHAVSEYLVRLSRVASSCPAVDDPEKKAG